MSGTNGNGFRKAKEDHGHDDGCVCLDRYYNVECLGPHGGGCGGGAGAPEAPDEPETAAA
jgi:hypothetical protein